MDHLVGSDVIQHQTDGLGGIEARGNGDQMLPGNQGETRVAPGEGKRGNQLAAREASHAFTERVDITHDVVAGRKGRARGARVEPATHENVGVGYTAGKHFDADLAPSGSGKILVDELKNFRAAQADDNDARVFL